MSTLKFAEVHNLVVFLSKPTKSEGFEQIVDFLNANHVQYALTINPIVYTSCIEQFWATVKAKTITWEVQLQALVDGKKVIITESTIRRDLRLEDAKGVYCLPNAAIFKQLTLMGKAKRKDTQVPQLSGPTASVAVEAVNEKMDNSLVRAATIASSLEVEPNSGNISKTQSKATPNESSSQETDSSGGPRCQENIRYTIAQTRSENVSKFFNDSLLAGVNTPQSDEDSLKLKELMKLCTTLQSRVLALEQTKTTQANKIDNLKRRVKKLEKKKRSKTYKLKRLYKVGLIARVESSEDEGLGEEDVSKQERIADIDANKDIYLVNVHTDKDMFGVNDLDGDEVIVKDPEILFDIADDLRGEESARPKADKVVIQESEQGTTTTTTAATIIIAASTGPKAKGLVIHKQEQAHAPTVSSQQPSQVKVLDKELAFMLQAEEEEEERLAREKAQQIKEVNIAWVDIQAKIDADYQLAQRLKTEEQEELTDEEKARFSKKAKAEVTKGSSNRDGEELKQENAKKQKMEDDKEFAKLKQCLEIILEDGDDVTIDATPFKMLKNFDREDLEVLWRLVKARFKKVKPVDYMDNFLLHNLKTMIEHHIEDNVWKD
nr:hypothetical protein [Tanacetum cinerariifolium]